MADLVQIGFVANADGIKSANREMNNLANSGDKADKALAGTARTVNVLAAALAAVGLGIGASEIIQYSDAWKNVNSQLRQVTGSEKELIATRSNLVKLTKDTRGDLLSTVELYASLTRATADLNVSQKDVAGVTKTINNLFLASGKGAKESAGAILQLSQGLAAGALRGDEFNSVAEGAPRIMDALAQKLGMARGELREFAATGGITAQILIDALKDYESEAQRLADSTEKTFGQNLVNARTNITEFVGGATMLNEVIGAIGGGIESFSEDLGVFVDSAQVAATVVGLALVPSMYKYVTSLVAATAAQLTMGTASVRTVSALGVVSTQAAATTVSMNALRMASAVFLGPIGIAIAAVGAGAIAFDHFSGGASKAEDTLEALRKEAALATPEIDKLADSTKRVQELDLKEKLSGLVDLRDQLAQSIGDDSFFSEDYLIRTTEDIRLLNAEIDETRSQLVAISGDFSHVTASVSAMGAAMSAAGSAMAEIKPSEEFEKLSYEIEKQIALHGDNSEAASLAYDIANGKVKDLAAGEGDLLVSRQKILDQMDLRAEKEKESIERNKEFLQLMDEADIEEMFNWDGIDPFAGLEDPKIVDALKEQQDEFNALIESVDEFGGAWSSTGSAVIDAVGGIADALDDYSMRMDAIGSKETELALAREKALGDPGKLAKIADAEKKLAKERTTANISGYKQMAGAAASMFSEQSKARKALHGLEVAFSAIEMALSIQKAFLAAKEAVLTQGKGDPYTAFARMAAMGAIVAAMGYAVGGGSGGGGQSAQEIQDAQGTGSVLGSDDKSESLINSFENFSDIAIDQLSELRGIRESLAKFQGGIAQLSMGVVTSGLAEQKYINFANQYVGDITRTGAIATRGSRSQDAAGRAMLAPLQSQIADIFGFISESIYSATESLGLVAENPAWAFISDIGKVSFEGLSGEEIQSELNAIFSQQADLITEFVLPAMKEYQQMGEGLFETLTRVAKEQAVFDDAIQNMGLSLGSLSNLMRIDVAQSIIVMMGGLEEFSDKTSEYFEAFFTESEKFDMLSASLAEAFGSIGVALPQTRDGFRAIVEGLDLTTEADQKLFASLMELVPGLDQYIEALDKSAEATANAAEKEKEAADAKEAAAKRAADDAMKAADTVVYNSMVDALKNHQKAVNESLSGAENALKKSFDAEKEAINSALGVRLDALNAQHEAEIAGIAERREQAQRAADVLRSASNEILGAYDAIAGGMSADTAQGNIMDALAKAWRGDFSGAMNLGQSLSAVQSGTFSTQTEQDIFNAETAFALSTLGGLTGAAASVQDRTLEQLIGAEEAAQLRHEESIQLATSEAEKQINALDKQLNELLGIDMTVLSLGEAIAQYEGARREAELFDYEAQVAILDNARAQLGELQRLNEEIAASNVNMQAALVSIAKHTSETASLVRRDELRQEDAA